jgi:hypothetical protein
MHPLGVLLLQSQTYGVLTTPGQDDPPASSRPQDVGDGNQRPAVQF